MGKYGETWNREGTHKIKVYIPSKEEAEEAARTARHAGKGSHDPIYSDSHKNK